MAKSVGTATLWQDILKFETTKPFLTGSSLTRINVRISFGFEEPNSDVTVPYLIMVRSVSDVGPVTSPDISHQLQPAKDVALK